MTQLVRLDAAESAFFQRQLESIKSKTYDVQYPELKARRLFPVSFEAGTGAESIVFYTYDQAGMAKVIQSYADDLPRADVVASESVTRIKSLGASYGYSIQEIRNAAMAGIPLQQRKANAARRAILQRENKIAYFGDATYNISGFLSNPNILTYTVPVGASTQTEWNTKTPDEILADLNGIVHNIVETTLEVETPDTLLLPVGQYNYIASTARSANSDKTILSYFLENNQYVQEVIAVNELKGSGTGGADQYVAYRRDPDKLTLEIPQEFEQFPPESRGLEEVVACHERIGGVIIYYPLSVCKGEGI